MFIILSIILFEWIYFGKYDFLRDILHNFSLLQVLFFNTSVRLSPLIWRLSWFLPASLCGPCWPAITSTFNPVSYSLALNPSVISSWLSICSKPSYLLTIPVRSHSHLPQILTSISWSLSSCPPSYLTANAFRSNALGQLIMDQYMNMVCSEWRQKCFRRVFNEIAKGPPNAAGSAVNISTSPPLLAHTTAVSTAGGRSVRFSAGAEKSVSEIGEISSSSGSGSCNTPSGTFHFHFWGKG